MLTLQVELSDMQAWLLAFFFTEVDFNMVWGTTNMLLAQDERRANAEATLRALRVLTKALNDQGFHQAGKPEGT